MSQPFSAFDTTFVSLEFLKATDAAPATESLGFITRFADVFIRGLYNFRANLVGMFRGFVRSELVAYEESHRIALARLAHTPTIDLKTPVAIPDGMKEGYWKTAEALDALFKKLDINATLKTLDAYLQDAARLGPKDAEALTRKTAAAAAAIDKVSRDTMTAELRRLFVDRKDPKPVPANKVIGSTRELHSICDLIRTWDANYRGAMANAKTIEALERKINTAVAHTVGEPAFDKAMIGALHDLVFAAAVQLDLYGVLLHEQQRVEHCWVLALHAISERYLDS